MTIPLLLWIFFENSGRKTMFSGYSKSFRDNRDNLLQAAKSTYNDIQYDK